MVARILSGSCILIENLPQSFSDQTSLDLAPRPPPPPSSPVSKLDRRHTGRLKKRDNILTGQGWKEVGRGAESYELKKAWSFNAL